MAIFDFSDYDEEKKKKKPSQVAKEEVEKKKTSSQVFDFSDYKPRKVEATVVKPVEKKQTFIEKAKGLVKKAGELLLPTKKNIFGEPVEKTAVGKPVKLGISDDDWVKQVGLVQQYKQEAIQLLSEAEKEKASIPALTQVDPMVDKKINSLKWAIRDYDEFLGNEQSNRGIFREFYDAIKKVGVSPDWYEGKYGEAQAQAVNKYKNGEELTKEEQGYINTFRATAYQNLIKKGAIEAAAAIPAMMPKYGLEIAMYSAGAKSATSALATNAMKIPSKLLSRIVPNIINNSVNMAVASQLNIPGIDAKTAEYMTPIPDYEKSLAEGKDLLAYLKPGDTPEKSKVKANLNMMIEYVSEGVGGYIDDALPFVKKLFIAKWLKNKNIPSGNPSLVKRVLNQIKFDSLVSEVIEEEVGEPFQAMVEERDYYNPFTTPEGRERLLVETLGIGAFAGIAKVTDTTLGIITKRRNNTGNKIEIEVDTKEPPPPPAPLPPVKVEQEEKPKEKQSPEDQKKMLNEMKTGTDKFGVGEVFKQKDKPEANTVIVSGKDTEGNILGNYVHEGLLSPAKFKPEELEPFEVTPESKKFVLSQFGIKPTETKGVAGEFKVGDTLDPQGNTNMVGEVTIRAIEGNTLKLTDSEGTEFSGMARSTVRELIKGGSWKRVETKPAKIKPVEKPKQIEKPVGEGIKTAKDAAKDMIRSYVERGDTIKDLSSGQMGVAGGDYDAGIGGYLNGKKIGNDKVKVTELNGKEVSEVFSLKQLFDEIKSEKVEIKPVEKPTQAKGEVEVKPEKPTVKKSLQTKPEAKPKQAEWIIDQIFNNQDNDKIFKDYLIKEGNISEEMADKALATRTWVQSQPGVVTNAQLAAKLVEELPKPTEPETTPEVKMLERKLLAETFWARMDDNEKAGVKMGMFPKWLNDELLASGMDKDQQHKVIVDLMKVDESGIIKEYEKPNVSGSEPKPRELPGAVREGEEPAGGIEEAGNEPSEATGGKRGERPTKSGKRPTTWVTPKEQVELNKKIEALVEDKGEDATKYSDEEKELLKQYTGAGGLEKGGTEGRGLLDEYYTPQPIVDLMWEKVKAIYPEGEDVLEPAVGIGRFINNEKGFGFKAYEINKTSATITKVLYPEANVENDSFESIFIDERGNSRDWNWQKKDIVIGNPPYGEHRGRYLGLGEEPKIPKYEEYFLKRGLDMLYDDGVLAYVMPSSFLRGSTSYAKQEIEKMGKLVEAYRLPNGVFGTTDIGTDILIFKKGKEKTLSGLLSDDSYFVNYPKRILGEVLKGKGNYGADLVKGTLNEALRLAGKKEEAKEPTIQTDIEATPQEFAEDERKLDEGRVEAPPAVTNAANKKAILTSKKKDKTIKLSDVSPEERGMWENVEATGELNIDYINRKYPEAKSLKDFNNKDIAVEPGDNNLFYPNVLYYQGNIYDKIDNLEAHKSELNPEQYQRQKEGLAKVLPEAKAVTEIHLKPNSSFAGQISWAGVSLIDRFKEWLGTLPNEVFGESNQWEVGQYINGSVVNTGDKLLNIQTRKRRREVGNRLFNRYLRTEISPSNMKIIENQYNRTFNSYYRPEYKSIPLLSEVNSHFKGNPLQMTDLQKEGAAFLASKGVGLLGYDVGLGKTMTAIVAVNEVMKKGWVKKPLIIVPNSVYLQWIREIQDLIPGVKINSLANLGGRFKGDLKTLEVEDGTISLITYDGLTKLGFRMETYDELTDDLKDVMAGQTVSKRAEAKAKEGVEQVVGKAIRGTTGDRFFEDLGFDHLTIDEVQNFKNIFAGAKMERRGSNEYRNVRGSSSMRGVKAYLMTQYILKQNKGRNVFALSATPFTNSPMEIYSILSLMGKKRLEQIGLSNVNDFMSMFMDMNSKFVVKANQTVVEEDVIEGFSNLQQLQKIVTEFIDFRTGEEVGIERPARTKRTLPLSPTEKQVEYILQAQSLFQDKDKGGAIVAITELQNITLSPYLSRYYTPAGETGKGFYVYEDGEYKQVNGQEIKLVDNVETFIHKSDNGWRISEATTGSYFVSKPTREEAIDAGKEALEGYGISQTKELIKARIESNGISPRYIKTEGSGMPKLNYKSFVNNSPKIKYAVEAVAQVHKDNKDVGQIIYMPRGVEFFNFIKQYLIKEKGFKPDQIGVISGGMSVDAKYAIQNKFNSGAVKVLIGSEAMKEGVNLQERSTDMYHLHLPWNPTDMLQVEGRIWRQGNAYKNVRIHYPLIENSVDSFIFQKLETKEKRIRNLWSYKGNEISVGDLDFENMKLDLITDPVIRAKAEETFEKAKETRKLETLKVEHGFASRKLGKLSELKEELKDMRGYKQDAIRDEDTSNVEYYTRQVKKALQAVTELEASLKKQGIELEDLKVKSEEIAGEIKVQEKAIEDLTTKYKSKIKTAETERISLVAKPVDYKAMMSTIAQENKTFFEKRPVLRGKYTTAPSGTAFKGEFSELENITKKLSEFKIIPFPEMLRLAKELSGMIPRVVAHRGAVLGKFQGMMGISLDYSVFEKPETAAKVLAHEIGHLVDWLPDQTMARGNLLGRLATLEKQLKWIYGDLDNKVIKKELQELSMKWSPYDETQVSTGYIKYRNSARELYADAISVLLNDPERLAQEAPEFYKGFTEYLDRKPKVREEYMKLNQLLERGSDEVNKVRLEEMYKGFEEAKTKRKNVFDKKVEKKSKAFRLATQHITKFYPIYDKLRGMPEKQKVRETLEEMAMSKNDIWLDLERNEREVEDVIKKAGVTENQLGAWFVLERNLSDRVGIANPDGLIGDLNKEVLSFLEKNFTPDQQSAIKTATANFHKATFEIVDEMYKQGMIKPEVFKEKIEPFRDTYVTFGVVKYIDKNYVNPNVKHMRGTLSKIENPLITTMFKRASMLQAIALHKGKKAIVTNLKQHFPDEIKESKHMMGIKHQKIYQKTFGQGQIGLFENGTWTAYDVDPYFESMFDQFNPKDVHTIVDLANKFNRVFKPVVTTYKIGWALYNNPMRDIQRTMRNLAAIYKAEGKKYSRLGFLADWIKTIPEGFKFGKGELTELGKEAIGAKSISTPWVSYDPTAGEDKALYALYRKYNFLAGKEQVKKIQSIREKIIAPLKGILGIIELAGSTFESTTKLAAHRNLMKRFEDKNQVGFYTRNYLGTPNYLEGGTMKDIDNSMFVFSNIMLQGLRSDAELIKSPKSRGAYFTEMFLQSGIWKVLMVAAASGFLGATLKDKFAKMTEYDKSNYITVPLCYSVNGKVAYWRIPQDELNRLAGAIIWKTGTALSGHGVKPEQILNIGAGYLPSLSPMFEVVGAWFDYIEGKNPYDSFYGRSVLDTQTAQIRGAEGAKQMFYWTLNKVGLGNFTTYDVTTKTTIEKIIQFAPILNRAMRITDYGLTEREKDLEKQETRESAIQNKNEKDVLIKAVEKYVKEGGSKSGYKSQVIKDLGIKDTTEKNRIKKEFDQEVLKREGDTRVRTIMSLRLNTTKIKTLKKYKDEMDRGEFNKLMKELRVNKVISDTVIKEVNKYRPEQSSITRKDFLGLDIFKVKQAYAAELGKSDLPYRLESIKGRDNTVRLYYPSGAYSDISYKELPRYGALIQENYGMFNVGEYPKNAPDWLGEKKNTKESISKMIDDNFGEDADNMRRVLETENFDWKTGTEVDIDNYTKWDEEKQKMVWDNNRDREPDKKPDPFNEEEMITSTDRGLNRINNISFLTMLRGRDERAEMYKRGIIPEPHPGWKGLDKAKQQEYWDLMLDPELNTKMAKFLLDKQGWCAWKAAPKDLCPTN